MLDHYSDMKGKDKEWCEDLWNETCKEWVNLWLSHVHSIPSIASLALTTQPFFHVLLHQTIDRQSRPKTTKTSASMWAFTIVTPHFPPLPPMMAALSFVERLPQSKQTALLFWGINSFNPGATSKIDCWGFELLYRVWDGNWFVSDVIGGVCIMTSMILKIIIRLCQLLIYHFLVLLFSNMNIISHKVDCKLKGYSGNQNVQSNNQNITLLLRIGTTFILFSMEREGEINANKWSSIPTKCQWIMFNCCIAS